MARDPGADGAVGVLHRVVELHLLAVLEERPGVGDDLGIQRIRHRVARPLPVVFDHVRFIDPDQHRVEVEIIEMRRPAADLGQHVGAPQHLVDRARPQGGQDLAHLVGQQAEEIHHLVGAAGEPLAQRRVLGADPHRAGVRLALAHHDAAHGDQGCGADAVFLGPHHRRDDDVAPGPEPAIGAQRDAVAQVVQRQHLMDLGQAHLPRQAGVFDRGLGRGAGAAVVARNQDHVGLGLGHPGGDGAHPA